MNEWAAVLLASNRVVKFLPIKAAYEEPEGDDFRLSGISLTLPCFVNNDSRENSPPSNERMILSPAYVRSRSCEGSDAATIWTPTSPLLVICRATTEKFRTAIEVKHVF